MGRVEVAARGWRRRELVGSDHTSSSSWHHPERDPLAAATGRGRPRGSRHGALAIALWRPLPEWREGRTGTVRGPFAPCAGSRAEFHHDRQAPVASPITWSVRPELAPPEESVHPPEREPQLSNPGRVRHRWGCHARRSDPRLYMADRRHLNASAPPAAIFGCDHRGSGPVGCRR